LIEKEVLLILIVAGGNQNKKIKSGRLKSRGNTVYMPLPLAD